MLDLGTDKGE